MSDPKAADIMLRRKTLAYLMASQDLSEKEAAARLDGRFGPYSMGTASRDFKEAKKQGWYRAVFAREECSAEELRAIEVYAHADEELERRLKRDSGGVLQHVRIFPAGISTVSGAEVNWDEALPHFGWRASGYVEALLGKARVIGVGWGHTVAEVVEGVAARGRVERSKASSPIVLPTSGEPLGEAPSSRSSSAVAARLNDVIGGSKRYTLNGVPPVIPEEFHGKARSIVLDFIGHLRSYREVFGDSGRPRRLGLIDGADTLLTSAGSFHSWRMYKNELVTIGGISKDQLRELSVGDIGGVLIPRAGLSRSAERTFERISSLWTGITLAHYQQVADVANIRKGHPGVVLCACGEKKAEIVRELVSRCRIVNELIIDDTLAEALR